MRRGKRKRERLTGPGGGDVLSTLTTLIAATGQYLPILRQQHCVGVATRYLPHPQPGLLQRPHRPTVYMYYTQDSMHRPTVYMYYTQDSMHRPTVYMYYTQDSTHRPTQCTCIIHRIQRIDLQCTCIIHRIQRIDLHSVHVLYTGFNA